MLVGCFSFSLPGRLTQQSPHQINLAPETSAVDAHPQVDAQSQTFAKTQGPILTV